MGPVIPRAVREATRGDSSLFVAGSTRRFVWRGDLTSLGSPRGGRATPAARAPPRSLPRVARVAAAQATGRVGPKGALP